jgi:hypothetical protein
MMLTQPQIYQVLHPWHWLTYKATNAEAVAAAAGFVAAATAILGLYGLWRYVAYTRRMMAATEASLRATFRPLLQIVKLSVQEDGIHVNVDNIGNGPAIHLIHWSREAANPHSAEVDDLFDYVAPKVGEDGLRRAVLPPSQIASLVIDHNLKWSVTRIFITAIDSAGNAYQTSAVTPSKSFGEWPPIVQGFSERTRLEVIRDRKRAKSTDGDSLNRLNIYADRNVSRSEV